MKKTEVQQRVLQNGKPLDLDKFSWDKETKTFSTTENNLVLDFAGFNGYIFITGWGCNLITGNYCTFKTGSYCTFKTGDFCTFITVNYCTFTTGWGCTFITRNFCTFTTGIYCTFTTGSDCIFTTGSDCTFITTGSYCTFTTRNDCVCVRKDVFEFFQIPKKTKIQLNEYGVKGFEVLEEIS